MDADSPGTAKETAVIHGLKHDLALAGHKNRQFLWSAVGRWQQEAGRSNRQYAEGDRQKAESD